MRFKLNGQNVRSVALLQESPLHVLPNDL